MSTLKEVAAAAGVHVATASAVLNAAGGNTRVGESTRERVLAAAKQLSYVANESARRLRQGRSNAVGFLGGDLRNPFFAELAASVEGELGKYGLQLLVSHVGHTESASLEKTIQVLQRQGVQNIICWEEGSRSRKNVESAKALTLSIGFTRQDRPGVWLDLESALQIAVEDMTRRGFRRLGFFAPQSQGESPSVLARSQVFAEECARRNLAGPVLASYRGESWDLDAAFQGAESVLKTHKEVEAWLGFNDVAALGLLSRFSKKDSARVLCFDGTTVARCWPGRPPRLDLRIGEMARIVADVVAGKELAKDVGKRARWLRPALIH
jgi:DNA-binding LacI/PurR family transcriptional regulator